MVPEVPRKVYIGNVQVLAIHEFLKWFPREFFDLRAGHSVSGFYFLFRTAIVVMILFLLGILSLRAKFILKLFQELVESHRFPT